MAELSKLLVLGGARSGKSRYAQARAEACDGLLVFVATAQAFDDEMAERIARHRADRDHRWRTIEAPLDLAITVRVEASEDRVLLIDCLTLWAANVLLAERDPDREIDDLVKALAEAPGRIICVSNEVGLGIVPDNPLARRFRDIAGLLNQRISNIFEEVQLTVAGLPLRAK